MKLKNEKSFYFLLSILLLFISSNLYGQIEITGKVQDSSGSYLAGATVIIQSLVDSSENQYQNTDDKGTFSFVVPHGNFLIKVSHMGFNTVVNELILNNQEFIVVKLLPQIDKLDEVILDYKPRAIQVNKDTLTFLANRFADGEEYKLKSLIQKLPGVEYINGVLSINGKKITKVLIEGNQFFNGSTSLAVENIPANAVKELNFIDDFSDSPILKNLEDSDKTVLNIKLKEDKKEFYFGDIEFSIGNKEYYNLNPSLFKYSKKQKYALIGAANNIGAPLKNILALNESMSPKNEPSFSLLDEFRFSNKNVQTTSEKALGVALDQNLKKNQRLLVNVIGHQSERNFLINSYRQYFTGFNLKERRELKRNLNFQNYFARLIYENESINNGELKILTEYSEENKLIVKDLNSDFNMEILKVNSKEKQKSRNLKSEVNLLKKINSQFTFSSTLSFFLQQDENLLYLVGNEEFLEQYFFKAEGNTGFEQSMTDIQGEISFKNDIFYSFNNMHSLKLSGNVNHSTYEKNFDTEIYKDSLDQNIFNNPLNSISEFSIETSYFLKDENYNIQLGLGYLKRYLPNEVENNFLPQLSIEYNPSFGNEIKAEYSISTRRPDITNFFEGGILKEFNVIEIGNINLASEKYQNFLFSSLFTNLRKGLTFRGEFNLLKTQNPEILTNVFSSINSITRFSNLNISTKELRSRIVVGKIFSKFKINGTVGYHYTNTIRGLNERLISQNRYSTRAKVNLETLFEKSYSNFVFNYLKSANYIESGSFERNYISNTYTWGVKDNSGKFTYLAEYKYVHNANHFGDSFSDLHFYLKYNFGNSPWLLAFSGENLLNTKYLNSQSFQDAYINEVQTARLPAIVLLGITYKM